MYKKKGNKKSSRRDQNRPRRSNKRTRTAKIFPRLSCHIEYFNVDLSPLPFVNVWCCLVVALEGMFYNRNNSPGRKSFMREKAPLEKIAETQIEKDGEKKRIEGRRNAVSERRHDTDDSPKI